MTSLDYEILARQLMRALRGKRSQTAFSRRLGYESNVAYAWESGHRAPTAREMFRAAKRVRVDVRAAIAGFFYGRLPEALAHDASSAALVPALLRELRGPAPITRLASRAGLTPSTMSRILAGKTEPRLPVFLHIVDAATRRVLDLLAGLVDLERVPIAREEWRRMEAIRRLSSGNPLFESIPRVLELDQYTAHRPGWIAERLGISREEEENTLADLASAGLIRWAGARWQVDRERSVDTTRGERAGARTLQAHWTDVAAARIRADDGKFSYLVFTTDDATLAALAELQLRHFRELRALAASSTSNTRVAVLNLSLFTIAAGG
jgi:transcriptional regulator with XRE-family HTH domain